MALVKIIKDQFELYKKINKKISIDVVNNIKNYSDFNKLAGKEETKILLDRIVLVYDKHMTHDVIKQLIKMFSTPFWIEWKQKMPAISKEAGLVGSEWTQEIMQSESFKKKLDSLVSKYDLEKLNSMPEKPHLKNKTKN